MAVPTILENINARKREEIAERSDRVPLAELKARAADQSVARGFVRAMEARLAQGQSAIIAEIKKASPSKGVIRENFHPDDIARSYALGGACCISVLTDRDYFQGSEEYLVQARAACDLPVIRKDFLIDPYQIYEARAIGADCVLLIVASLEKSQLLDLNNLALEIGLDVLIEVHNEAELDIALETGNRLIGINNRDLHTFETRLGTTLDLVDKIGDERILVTESGILEPKDVQTMRSAGVNAFLVGEAFMRASDPGEALRKLFF